MKRKYVESVNSFFYTYLITVSDMELHTVLHAIFNLSIELSISDPTRFDVSIRPQREVICNGFFSRFYNSYAAGLK